MHPCRLLAAGSWPRKCPASMSQIPFKPHATTQPAAQHCRCSIPLQPPSHLHLHCLRWPPALTSLPGGWRHAGGHSAAVRRLFVRQARLRCGHGAVSCLCCYVLFIIEPGSSLWLGTVCCKPRAAAMLLWRSTFLPRVTCHFRLDATNRSLGALPPCHAMPCWSLPPPYQLPCHLHSLPLSGLPCHSPLNGELLSPPTCSAGTS